MTIIKNEVNKTSSETPTEGSQICPQCGSLMNNMPGSRDAVCKNCGFKDPCCE